MLELIKTERLESGHYYDSGKPVMWYYVTLKCPICECEFTTRKANHKTVKSCRGCRNKTHSQSGTRHYHIWEGMKQRCTNPKIASYPRYGGKGVKVLFTSYEHFYEWSLANGYEDDKGLTIDRIDSKGNYEPSNCRWISASLNYSLPNRKAVNQICKDTGVILASYVSAKEASDNVNMAQATSIIAVCKGKRKTAGGFAWEYAEKVVDSNS